MVKLTHVEDPSAWWRKVTQWWQRRALRAHRRGETAQSLKDVASEIARIQCVHVPPRPGKAPSPLPSAGAVSQHSKKEKKKGRERLGGLGVWATAKEQDTTKGNEAPKSIAPGTAMAVERDKVEEAEKPEAPKVRIRDPDYVEKLTLFGGLWWS